MVVGGTGLYLRVLFHGLFDAPTDADLRDRLKTRYLEDPLSVYRELERLDPAYARSISPHDRVRVVRALEIYYLSGVTMSEQARRPRVSRRKVRRVQDRPLPGEGRVVREDRAGGSI